MGALLLKIDPRKPDVRRIHRAAEILKNDGIGIIPTDTIYAFMCRLGNKKGIERIIKLKGLKSKKVHFSLICNDLSEISHYTSPISRPVFKLLNKNLPGPFTFVLQANKQVSNFFDYNKKTIGIRIPSDEISVELPKLIGEPVITTSIHHEDEILQYETNPEMLFNKYQHHVDVMLDASSGAQEGSTVVDVTNEEPAIIRQGLGELAM